MNIRQMISTYAVKLIQRFGPRTVTVAGKTYAISGGVFNPKYYMTSEFMAAYVRVKPGDVVLDMGTGSGIQAITAAQYGGRVTAVDINPEAIRHAWKNVEKNGLSENVTLVNGDLFSPLDQKTKYDIILFTPPYFEGTVKTQLDHALYDPEKSLLKRFFSEAGKHLKTGGYVQMVYSSIAGHEHALEIARDLGWQGLLVAEKPLRYERLFIYRFEPEKDLTVRRTESER
jgi:release factor glutamine methyltransferase